MLTSKDIAKMIDHSLLKPELSAEQVREGCRVAKQYDTASVCVKPSDVVIAKEELEGTDVLVTTVIGFPHGAHKTAVKVFEAQEAIKDGAVELDMVLNIGRLLSREFDYVKEDIETVVAIADEHDAIVKVILETCLLTDEEVVKACELSMEAGAAFVKTSTGFSKEGATAHHVSLMKKTVGDTMEVKASGGIRDLKKTMEMIEAGADRIGASASVEILKEAK